MPNGLLYKIISLLGMLFFIILNLNYIDIDDIKFFFRSGKILIFSFSSSYLVSGTGYIVFYLHNFFSSTTHVRMIVMIQKSFRLIHFHKYKNIIIDNWSYIVRHFIPYFILIFLKVSIPVIIYFFSLVYFEVYIYYGVCLSKLLRGGIRAWMSELQYHTRVSLNINNKGENTWKILFQVYKDLMEAFSIFKSVFQVPVSIIITRYYVFTFEL